MQQRRHHKLVRWIALFLSGAFLQFLFSIPTVSLAQNSPANANSCSQITAPLTPEEQIYARSAWQYFVNNYQENTGFTNSTGGYPSGTLWDIGNYLMALNAARWMNMINQSEFDSRLNKFLTNFANLKLFENALPNKVYNTANGQMTDYGNNPLEKGIGWSALDIGRILAAFHIIGTCHPQYNDWLKGIIAKWQVARSLKDDQLYGAVVLPDGKTLLVQEGRLGYEEYAVRGYELWGFKAPKAVELEPFKFVEVNGVQIPVDSRDFQTTNANNYVVSESYILDGIEFGLESYLKKYAADVLEVQKRRFESTGQLTAVSEDNIDQAPYFLYNTVYSNGVPWATITDENKPYPQLRSISTKAAFGWRYLYPDNAYAQKVFDAVKDLRDPQGGGFYAGLYEETKQPNKSLTGNTNGLIMEILYYKARGNQPLIGSSGVSFAKMPSGSSSPADSTPPASTPPASTPPTETSKTPIQNPIPIAVTPAKTNTASSPAIVKPIPPVGNPQPSTRLPKPLTVVQRRYAQAAWNYFVANSQAATGLVSDRSDIKGSTLWGLGDYLSALNAAWAMEIISPKEFDQRIRQLLGALAQIPLYSGELPSRGYDPRTLQPVDYGGNPVPEGTGWSSLDVGRLLTALYSLKTDHPEYIEVVDQIVLDWSYLRVVREGILSSANVIKDKNGRSLPRINPETRLGYEEYAARGFQLWGFNVDKSAVGGEYKTASVEGVEVPIERMRTDTKSKVNQYTVSNPFLLYALEFGLDPKMRSLFTAVYQAQAQRYRNTGTLTASATTLIERQPYTIHSSIIGQNQPWVALGDDGKPLPEGRLVSSAVAFAYYALLPEDSYTQELIKATTDLYNPLLGFYEGFYEKTGKTAFGSTSSTNSMILQSLLYTATKQQPLIRPHTAMNSPWWQAVAKGNSGRGLPNSATQKSQFMTNGSENHWDTLKNGN
ncbi:DUF3131 domain-containing protein [Anabaena cylindrica UHCC 0172]|uniref:DUF3131 domain-containing protein n=1 Tax=Anabaena cylindrica TaxID=1165 RepID=UPI002B208C0B|nr:DUF3131 domain-containing protein [Anabaena cylindrica]MEA5552647.1 DUF3131 domain-containing protein [Anabaena cylindrica UHCC 0172]